MSRAAALGCLLVIAGGAAPAGAEEKPAEGKPAAVAPPRPDGPGVAPGRYRLVEVHVVAMGTTKRDRPWDDAPGEAPDLGIKIRVDGNTVGTCRAPDDTPSGRCALDLEIAVGPATQIELDVIDRDTLFDDAVGTAALGEPGRWGLGGELPMVPAGRLISAAVVLARVPTWWDQQRGRVLGLAGGVLIALAVIGGFRRRLLPPPAPAPRCTHCHALLGADLAKCFHCGAIQIAASGPPEGAP